MIASIVGSLPTLRLDVPVDPDGDQASEWLIGELSKPEYQVSKPTLWDQISKAVWDWFTSLQSPDGLFQAPLFALIVIVIAAIILAAFLIFGRPRRNRRSARVGSLFGLDEERTAEELRRAAGKAAANGDWVLAIEELFRSIARRMSERVLLSTNPGTTAHGFAGQAGTVFPAFAAQLSDSAAVFDGVRYLSAAGSEEQYRALVTLESELRTLRPAGVEVTAP